jgi:hypothetical protein
VSPGRANLFFEEIKVVEEPFPCRCNPPIFFYGLCKQVSNFMEDVFILTQPCQQSFRDRACAQYMGAGKGLAVLLHLGGAEQLRSERRFITNTLLRQAASTEASPQMGQAPDPGLFEGRQVRKLLVWYENVNQPDCCYGSFLDPLFAAVAGKIVRWGY